MIDEDSCRTHPHTLIFDGECGVCRRSMEWLRSADREGRIAVVPYQDPEVARRFAEIPRQDMEEAMQLVAPDGTRWQGARAAEQLLEMLPGWRLLAPFFRIPGVRRVARWIYRAVARNRRHLGCGEHCRLPAAED